MNGDPVRDYWDACVFLSWINEHQDRVEIIDALLSECLRSDPPVELVTSTLSIVEVSFAEAERQGRALDPEVQERINGLWTPESPFVLVEFFPSLASVARDLVRQAMLAGTGLQAADAMHLATARYLGAERVLTYDDKMTRAGTALGFKVEQPSLRKPDLFTGGNNG